MSMENKWNILNVSGKRFLVFLAGQLFSRRIYKNFGHLTVFVGLNAFHNFRTKIFFEKLVFESYQLSSWFVII